MLPVSPRTGRQHKAQGESASRGSLRRIRNEPAPRATAQSWVRSDMNLMANSFTNLILNILYGNR
jgi:hypothetical protein